MNSITKRVLNEQQIMDMTRKAFGKDVKIRQIKELTEGYFNNSYFVEIEDQEKYIKTVLKVAPKPDVKVLSYEEGLMEIEVAVFEEYFDMNISVPSVLFYDKTCDLIDSEYFFMTYLDGVPLNTVRERLSEEQYIKLSSDLAKDLLKTKDSVGICFGLPKISTKIFDSWYRCYKFMILELLKDSERIQMELPLGLDEKKVVEIIDKYKEDLMEVEDPILIHKDIWEGNIFVDKDTFEYMGMIDCERAIYAEPLLEAVCGFLDDNKIFMEIYYGTSDLSKSEENRLKLYKFYLFLLMVIEESYRMYDNEEHKKWTVKMLESAIKDL